MNTQNIKNKSIVEKINIQSSHGNILRHHDDTCELVKAAAMNIIDSCISLNEESYKTNLVLLTSYLNQLIAINDSFFVTSTLKKQKS